MGDTRLALDEYNKTTPPGWMPHMREYPLKLFKEKFRLFMKQTSLKYEEIGPVLLGRLKGAAYRLAMKVVAQRYKEISGVVQLDTTSGQPIEDVILREDDAIACYEQRHPISAAVLCKHGYEIVIDQLEETYGPEQHDVLGKVLDKFFKLYRGNSSLMDYCIAFKTRFEAAGEKAKLTMNNVGKTHLFIDHAGLSDKFIDDIMLKVDGDREKFDEIYTIVTRVARKHTNNPSDETHGHLLYVEDEEETGPMIEYYTDYNGNWYIYDWDLEAAYYLQVSNEEETYFQQSTWDYWDGCWNEEDYNYWTENWSNWQDDDGWTDLTYFQHEEEDNYYGRRKGKGRGRFRRRPFRRRKGKGKGFKRRSYYADEDSDDDEYDYYDEYDDDEELYFGGKGKGKFRRRSPLFKGHRKGQYRKGLGKGKGFKGKGMKGAPRLNNPDSTTLHQQQEVEQHHQEQPSEAFKGVSKGSPGCEECGSRYHKKDACPVLKRKKQTSNKTGLTVVRPVQQGVVTHTPMLRPSVVSTASSNQSSASYSLPTSNVTVLPSGYAPEQRRFVNHNFMHFQGKCKCSDPPPRICQCCGRCR